MSALIGGRSGNPRRRAQPCRLPYRAPNAYPLSLKDLCLASHIPALLQSGVTSLKLEGRMKSAEYVYAVTKIYRRLLDERRAAAPAELDELAAVFSRSGFTDGYFAVGSANRCSACAPRPTRRARARLPSASKSAGFRPRWR